jgi:3-hydroxyacyl-CoA dehydrogenase / enoyl-CoA hydratase / 3-hydroxybutyryl-CoA epimerase
MYMSSARLEIDSQRIATIWLDAPDKKVNTLSRQMWADLSAGIDRIEHERPAGLIITSGKTGTFVVGADLLEIRDMSDAEFDQYIRKGQEILKRLESLPMPTMAMIEGDCVGGGLELALACKLRVAMEVDAAIGLPELRLGLIPGWGGTVRLPRLIGGSAIELILDARMLKPSAARSSIVDDTFLPHEFASLSRRLMLDLIANPLPPKRQEFIGMRHFEPWLRNATAHAQTPAAKKALDVVQVGLTCGEQAGFDAERAGIMELRRTPEFRAALEAFFNRKKSG